MDLPFMVELNYGAGAYPDAKSDFGFFGGLGLGYSKIYEDGYINNGFGPLVNGGLKGNVGSVSVGCRVSYLFNTDPAYVNVLGLGVFYFF